jgi:hypothetical protein
MILEPGALAQEPAIKGRRYSHQAIEQRIGPVGALKRVDPARRQIQPHRLLVRFDATDPGAGDLTHGLAEAIASLHLFGAIPDKPGNSAARQTCSTCEAEIGEHRLGFRFTWQEVFASRACYPKRSHEMNARDALLSRGSASGVSFFPRERGDVHVAGSLSTRISDKTISDPHLLQGKGR